MTTAAILDVAANAGLPLVFVFIAIESIGIPVPGETALIAAALLASRGRIDIVSLILVASAAAIIGDNIGFAIGRRFGRRLLTAPGPFERHRKRALELGEPFFERHGPKAVFLGRWVSGLRITAAWMAGANRMRWPTFLFYNALGGIGWSASIALLSYYLGAGAEHAIEAAGYVGAGGVVVLGLSLYLVHRIRRRRAAELAAQQTPV